MPRIGLRLGITELIKIFLPIAFILVVLNVLSMSYLIPFFKVNSVVIKGKNEKILPLAKGILEKEFGNNYFLLRLNFADFKKSLEKSSLYEVKSVSILDFDFKNGVLTLNVKFRKPLLALDTDKFVAEDGVIFGKLQQLSENIPRVDLKADLDYGSKFKLFNPFKAYLIAKKFKLNVFIVNRDVIIAEGETLGFVTWKKDKDFHRVLTYLNRVHGAIDRQRVKIFVSTFGVKSVALKTIYKESENGHNRGFGYRNR